MCLAENGMMSVSKLARYVINLYGNRAARTASDHFATVIQLARRSSGNLVFEGDDTVRLPE
jgi:hypothetical protein